MVQTYKPDTYMLEATADLVNDTFHVDARVLEVFVGQVPTLLQIDVALSCPPKLLHFSFNCCCHPSCRNVLVRNKRFGR